MSRPLRLFAGYGVELEYAIVGKSDLAVRPICDVLLAQAAGHMGASEAHRGAIDWSNELCLHVVELKTAGPAADLTDALAEAFTVELRQAATWLSPHGATLLPGAMHPTMDPARDTRVWPHAGKEIYGTYDRIFGCSGHGWSNLQSAHLNLPFCGDDEFGRLHLAIRAVLPLLPALAASSPVMEGRVTGVLDNRLAVYRGNQRKLASIIGHVIPEPVTTRAQYEAEILAPMFAEIAPLDPEGELQYEWLNSRGAIARFDRDAIEIRLLDVQETPYADLAIALLVREAVRALVNARWVSQADLAALDTLALAGVLDRTIADADAAVVDHRPLLAALGCGDGRLSAGEVWTHLAEALMLAPHPERVELRAALANILGHGPLARRLVRSLGRTPSAARIDAVYRELGDCLLEGRLFEKA
jgi:glutamate---cysteine ligase / carboxylate-amine ligase